MDVLKASVPVSCFPRYKYMLKIRTDLARRYNGWMTRYNMEQYKLEEDVCTDNLEIILCKLVQSKEPFPDLKTIVPKNTDTISTESSQMDNTGFEKMTNINFTLLPSGGRLKCQAKFPKQIRFIGKDIKTAALPDIFSPRKRNIDICSKRLLNSDILAIELERYALTGMREACENLQLLLTGKYYRPDEGSRRDRIKDCGDVILKKQRSQSAVTGVSIAFAVPQGTGNNTSGRAHSEGAEHKTEKKKYHRRTTPQNIEKADREVIGRLFEEFVGVFNRSILHEDEKPCLVVTTKIEEKLLHDLRDLNKSIESCGYCCSTFQINVRTEDISENLKKDISVIMKSHGISNFKILSSGIREFLTCHVGQRIAVKDVSGYRYGSLGGFAKTSSEDTERKWAIFSDHLIKESIDGKVYVATDTSDHDYIGEVLKEKEQGGGNKSYLDIAAASLQNDIDIDSNFVTEDGDSVPGKPCLYDPERLRGLRVHIKGAATPLGRGIITMPEQFPVNSDNLDDNYIIVENRNKDEAFIQEGDSGAIVVAENPDKYGEEVQLISMVMGERLGQKGSYTTVRLDKGLEHLKSMTDKDFHMC